MEARPRSLQRLERERAGEVRGPGEPARADERQRRHRRHELRPVDQREPLLRRESDRLEPGGGERVLTGEEGPVEPRLPLADERKRQMRERCEIPTCPDRATRGHPRQHAAVEAFDQELDRLDSRARVALGERVRAEKHRRADDLVRVRLAHSARMAAEQAKLQLLDLVVRDRLRDEAAKPRVDAVGVLAHPLDERACRLHPGPRLVRERHRHTVDGDLPDVLDPKVVPRQGGARNHATSLAQDEHPRERMLIARKPLRGPLRGPKGARTRT